MPKNLFKRPRDLAQLAKLMIDIASGEVEDRAPAPNDTGKNAAAVALGRLGGEKGGVARAAKLSPKCLSENKSSHLNRLAAVP